MNKKILLVPVLIALITIGSCKKDKTEPTNNNPNSTTAVTPYGHFYIDMMDAILVLNDSVSGPDTLLAGVFTEVTVLIHADPNKPTGLSLDADSISLNGEILERTFSDEDTNAYFYEDDSEPPFISNGASWLVKGKSSVPAMQYADTRKQPLYTGPIPVSGSKAAGLSFNFNSSNVSYADSVTVGFGVDSLNQLIFSKTFAANAGAVTISAAELAKLPTEDMGLEIIPFTYTVKYFGGNPYAFIRNSRYVRTFTLKQ